MVYLNKNLISSLCNACLTPIYKYQKTAHCGFEKDGRLAWKDAGRRKRPTANFTQPIPEQRGKPQESILTAFPKVAWCLTTS